MIRLNKPTLLALVSLLLMFVSLVATPGHGATRPKVLASFSILGDLVAQVGGERIDLQVLVGPNQDAHMYQPRPADSARISSAALVVVNGLGFEGWIDRLVQASGYQGPMVIATEGLAGQPLAEGFSAEAQAQVDPHAWQSPTNVRRYIDNIARGLTAIDPAGADVYDRNANAFLHKLDRLEQDIAAAIAALPKGRRTVVTSHDAFGYFGRAYGLTFVAPQGVSTDSEASARDVAALIQQIQREKIPALFIENITDQRLLQQIARETGVHFGGTLYSDALSEPDGDAGTYLAMMRHNLHTLVNALHPSDLETL